MNKVTSRDGTIIAFDQLGDGPPVILVCGGSTDRKANAPLAGLLAEHFSVFNYDRRGRGDSEDTAPYAVEREVEDVDAVISAAGGSASVYGTSSGAALALEAAASGVTVRACETLIQSTSGLAHCWRVKLQRISEVQTRVQNAEASEG
jgi:pimeloyl-ACP methyl ester carboxylesterase